MMEREEWPRVGIIVLNWNGWRDTIECLESLQRITYPNYQIIVVDNGSTDGSVEALRQWISNHGEVLLDVSPEMLALARSYVPFELICAGFISKDDDGACCRVVLLETNINLGYSAGNNAGIAWALADQCEYFFILNNDTRVDCGILNVMIRVARESNASVVGAIIKDFEDQNVLFVRSSYPLMLLLSETQKQIPQDEWWYTPRVDGAGMLLTRDLLTDRWQSLGYFLDESLFLYCEEIELGLWCRMTGKRCVVASGAVVYHKLSKSSGGKGRPMQFYYITRNRILIAKKYLSLIHNLLFSTIYIPLRTLRAVMYAANGRMDISKAIIHGIADGYIGRSGRTI